MRFPHSDSLGFQTLAGVDIPPFAWSTLEQITLRPKECSEAVATPSSSSIFNTPLAVLFVSSLSFLRWFRSMDSRPSGWIPSAKRLWFPRICGLFGMPITGRWGSTFKGKILHCLGPRNAYQLMQCWPCLNTFAPILDPNKGHGKRTVELAWEPAAGVGLQFRWDPKVAVRSMGMNLTNSSYG